MTANTSIASKSALGVVNVQEGIADLTSGVPDADRINHAISCILRLARQHNDTNKHREEAIEILFIQHDDKNRRPFVSRKTDLESDVDFQKTSVRIDQAVSVITMTESPLGNMFESNSDLATSLHSQGVKHLAFVGLQTDFCVRASILGAIAYGFEAVNITLLRGAHSTYDNASTGKSYLQIKEDVEKELMDLGVGLRECEDFAL
ncbi:hypothetical protein M436DRAFT_77018 [Aureobasidium namibiae CBS 147.97]|uniref:Isochorismatase-like domain-containing protein n=1 Tax=Aureobasidium namibiae CBS 147.97 TaxID=1043004 RepID=A0A074W5Y1_9PEZI|nr:uncharacterized protein M436DRAFT_77018 [Aureobasidium namibiae CBS 147.97]KEQ68278.1 hypothetical protein M436DRAFT_77018 [Aureobasidium namibiae CBS 147.97]